MSFYANADFVLTYYVREIWLSIGRFQFYWVDCYDARTMTRQLRTRRFG